MTSWMLYAVLVGAAISVAAHAAARLLAAFRHQTRHLWMGALATTALAPGAVYIWRRFATTATSGESLSPLGGVLLNAWDVTASSSMMPVIQRVLFASWIVASSLLLLRMALGWRRLRLTMNDWHVAEVDGVPVMISEHVGPALLGVRRGRIVLPRWALAMEAPLRALVIRHEQEHRHARDPLALLAAALLCALLPWNPALWWQAARLRLSIEMDCDARVLRHHPEVERYGLLLLAIAHQRSSGAPVPSAALTEPHSLLERRIAAMSSSPSRRPTKLAALALLLASGIVLACTAPSPDATEPSKAAGVNATTSPTNANGPKVATEPMFEFQVESQATPKSTNRSPRYPDELRKAGVEGEVLAQFIVNRDGSVDVSSFKVLKSDHELFTAAVRQALPNFQFNPARVGGKEVRQLVQMPFAFSLTKTKTGKVSYPALLIPFRLEGLALLSQAREHRRV